MMRLVKILDNIKYVFSKKETFGHKCEGYADDISESDTMQHFGFFFKPCKNTRGLKGFLGENRIPFIFATKNYEVEESIKDLVADGEGIIYSTDDLGVVKTTVIFKKDGTLQLNGSAESIVLGNTLLTALQTLISEINNHTHAGNLGNPTSPPTLPVSNIDNTILSNKNFGG